MNQLPLLNSFFRTVFCGVLLLVPFFGPAQSPSVWTGGEGEFEDGGNWHPRGIPAAETPVEISSGTVLWNESDRFQLSRASETVIKGGTLRLSGSFRNGRGSAGSILLEKGGIEHSGNFFVLGHDAPGHIVQRGGSLRSTVTSGFYFSDLSRSDVVYEQHGGEVHIRYINRDELSPSWQFLLGRARNDRWTLHDGSVRIETGNGRFVPSGVLSSLYNRAVILARSSRLELKDGRFLIDRPAELAVGYRTPGNTVLHVAGGHFELREAFGEDAAIVLGTAAEGVLDMRGGELKVSVDQPNPERQTALLLGRDGGFGMVDMRGGLLDLGSLNLLFAKGENSVGQFNMRGGTLRVGTIAMAEVGSYGRFIFSGGEIFLEGDQRAIVNEAFFQVRGILRAEYLFRTRQTRLSIRP